MRTLDDLCDTFSALAEAATTYRTRQRAEPVVADPPVATPLRRPGSRWRAMALPALAATAVGLVVAGGLTLAGHTNRHAGTPHRSLPVLPPGPILEPAPKGPGDLSRACDDASTIASLAPLAALQSAPGLTVDAGLACSVGQQFILESKSKPAPWNGFVWAYAKGQYDPALAKKGQRTTVDGHPAWFGLLPEVGKSDGSNGELRDHCNPQPNWHGRTDPPCRSYAVVWEYAPDSWAAVVDETSSAKTPGSRQQALRTVASAVAAPDPTGLRMPMRLGYLPSGLGALTATSYFDPAHPDLWATGGSLRLGSGHKDATTSTNCDVTFDLCAGASLLVRVDWTTHRHEVGGKKSVPIRVNGHPGSFYADGNDTVPGAPTLDVQLGHWELQILVSKQVRDRYPVAELIKIAERVTFPSNGADQSTWFSAATVLP